jgi:heptosyltransferase II
MSENAKDLESLIIRIPNWVGDVVMATPALRSIRLGFPQSRIVLQGKAKNLELLGGLGFFDDTIPFKPVAGKGGKPSLVAEASRLREHRFERGLLLPNSFSSALIFFLGRVRNRIGYAINGRGVLLNRAISVSAGVRKKNPEAMTGYYLRIARFAGGAETDETVELATNPESDRRAGEFLEKAGLSGARPLIGLNAGASFGPSKLWSADRFAALSDRIHDELGGRTLLLCGPGEEEIARPIVAKARHPIIDTSGAVLPLAQLKSVLKKTDLLVTTDTGPRHIAVAVGTPSVVLMGPTNPLYTASNLARTRVIRLDSACAPCHQKICPLDYHACMEDISPDMVIDRVRELLSLEQTEVR